MAPHSAGGSSRPNHIPPWAYACSCLWIVTVFGFPALHCATVDLDYWTLMRSRIVAGVTTLPRWRGWYALMQGLAGFFLIGLPFGIKSGLLSWPPQRGSMSWRQVASKLVEAFATPGLWEELLFRVIPLPALHEAPELPTAWRAATITICLLVFAGPFHVDHQHHQGSMPIETFKDWRFVAMAFLLGAACTHVYVVSGSWPLVAAMHALPVWAWLCFMSGAAGKDPSEAELLPKPMLGQFGPDGGDVECGSTIKTGKTR